MLATHSERITHMSVLHTHTLRAFALLLISVAGILLPACSVHKIDVQQGNVITQEELEKLHLGMGKQQVQRMMGTPLVVDPFHADRWDYIYRFLGGDSGEQQSAYLTLYFHNDRLSKIDVHNTPPKEAEVKKPANTLN
jgi:outer membrane protein assembly factor BamE